MCNKKVSLSLQELYRMIQGAGSLCEAMTSLSDGSYEEDICMLELGGLPVVPMGQDFTVAEACSWSYDVTEDTGYLLRSRLLQCLHQEVTGNRFVSLDTSAFGLLEESRALDIVSKNPEAEWVFLHYPTEEPTCIFVILMWLNNSLYVEFLTDSYSFGMVVLRADTRTEHIPFGVQALITTLALETRVHASTKDIVFYDGINDKVRKLQKYGRAPSCASDL